MSRIEEVLREAYQEAAVTIRPDRVRPAVPLPAAGRRRLRRPALALFAPLAAAVSVTVAIAAALTVPRLIAGSTAPAVSRASTPPFMVVTVGQSADPGKPPKLEVLSAATRRVVSSLDAPGRDMWTQVAATGDDRRFVVILAPRFGGSGTAGLYSFALTARGAITGLTRLAVLTGTRYIGGLAVSADGSTVAYEAVTECETMYCDYVVRVIAHGMTRQWASPASVVPSDLTLSGDGSTLAFTGTPGEGLAESGATSAWVLSTSSAPGSLTAASRQVFSISPTESGQATTVQSAIVSSDGSTLYVLTKAIWPITSSPTAASGPASPAPSATATPSPSAPGQLSLTAYSTADDQPLGVTATWPNSFYAPLELISAGDDFCALSAFDFASGQPAYLIDPSTRTITGQTLPVIGDVDSVAW